MTRWDFGQHGHVSAGDREWTLLKGFWDVRRCTAGFGRGKRLDAKRCVRPVQRDERDERGEACVESIRRNVNENKGKKGRM